MKSNCCGDDVILLEAETAYYACGNCLILVHVGGKYEQEEETLNLPCERF